MDRFLILHSGHYYFNKSKGKFELSDLAKLRLLAASVLYKRKTIDKIILTGGSVYGKDKPTVSVLSIPFLKGQGVFKKDLIIDDRAFDTVGEIQLSLPKFGKSIPFVISDKEHLKRIRMLYKNWGIKAKFLVAEEVFGQPAFGYSKLDKTKEIILRKLVFLDRRGFLVSKIVKFTRR